MHQCDVSYVFEYEETPIYVWKGYINIQVENTVVIFVPMKMFFYVLSCIIDACSMRNTLLYGSPLNYGLCADLVSSPSEKSQVE